MESIHCFFVFGWIKINFSVRDKFKLLISNINSQKHYQFAILRKCHFSSSRSLFLSQHSLMNWLQWQEWVVYLQSFNFKNFYICLPNTDIGLVKISWTVLEIFSQNLGKSATLSAVSFWWGHKVNMTMTSTKTFVNLWRFLPIVYPYQFPSSSDMK